MRTIIAGSRSCDDFVELITAISECGFKVTSVVSGGAKGADKLGEQYAIENNLRLTVYYANWDSYGVAAGHIRNAEMAEDAEALIALWDGVSKGTANMIANARRKKLKTHIHMI
jgi:hypothetical protein